MQRKYLMIVVLMMMVVGYPLQAQHAHESAATTTGEIAGEHAGEHADSHAGEAGKEEGHGHGSEGEAAATEKSIEELMKDTCEHKMPMIECDECRYELGAVKLDPKNLPLVTIEKMGVLPNVRKIEVTGEVRFDENHIVCLKPRFAGRLASISLRIGDPVLQGQPVFVIESHELAQAAIDLLKRSSELELFKKKLERETTLRKKKISSEQELQEAQAAVDLAQIELENAGRRLALFGVSEKVIASVGKNSKNPVFRGEMVVSSPMGGRLVFRDGNIGDAVDGEHELIKVANLKHLWGVVQVHEREIQEIIEALKTREIQAVIKADAFPGVTFPAVAQTAEPQMNAETRTLPVRLLIENHGELLRPGMFIKAELYLGDPRTLPTIPTKALFEDEGKVFVFVRHGEHFFFRRNVIRGPQIGDRTAIQGGISAGDDVVVDGGFLLKSDILREKMGAGCAD